MRMYGDPTVFIKQPETNTIYVSGQTDAQFFYSKMCAAEEKRKEAEAKLKRIEESDVGKLNEAVYQFHKTLTNVQTSLDNIRCQVSMPKNFGGDKPTTLNKLERLQTAIQDDITLIMEDLYGKKED